MSSDVLTRHHHNLKEELERLYKPTCRKCVDIVFPEHNSLFNSKIRYCIHECIGVT